MQYSRLQQPRSEAVVSQGKCQHHRVPSVAASQRPTVHRHASGASHNRHEMWLEHDSDGHYVVQHQGLQHQAGLGHGLGQGSLPGQHNSQLESPGRWAVLRQPAQPPPAPLRPARAANPNAINAFQLVQRKRLAGGWLELVRWESAPSERLLRIWLPPGYYQPATVPGQPASNTPPAATASSTASVAQEPDEELLVCEPPEGGWPVFFLNDAQNLYEDHLSFSGCSWKAAHVASELITSGAVPPFVIVGMDHAGVLRSFEYTPYRPGIAPGGWRQDAAAWPGGGVHDYLTRVVKEVVPWSQAVYQLSRHADRMGFGGSSFGGICTLCMSMRFPDLFGSVLIESPSLWIAEEHFLRRDITQYKGSWPKRIWIAMGGSEYKNDGSQVFSQMLVGYLHTLRNLLQHKCAEQGSLLGWEVVLAATHNEKAWQDRLPKAWTHLCGHWNQPLTPTTRS